MTVNGSMNGSISMKYQAGVGLVEVLIAMLVMAIGLLGIAGMQSSSIKMNTSSMMRSQASILTASLLESIRTNPSSAYVTGFDSFTAPAKDCNLATCTPAEMAVYDVARWKCSLGAHNAQTACASGFTIQGNLPDGKGSITRTGNSYTVSVRWIDEDNGDRKTFSMSAVVI